MKVLIPDGEAASDPSWTNLGRGAFNSRRIPTAGSSDSEFINRLRMTNSVPIGVTTAGDIALVGTNQHRALLIIQNNSTATSPDSAPTFYIGFGIQPKVGYDLGLPPGVGIVLDVRVPTDAIYVAFGPYTNTNHTVLVQGVVKEGGITDATGDTANINDTQQVAELVGLLKAAFKLG